MRQPFRFRHRKKGQAMVEGAFVLMAMLLLLIGILDFGQLLFFHQSLMERARAGARYGVANTYDTAAITNVVLYNSPTAPPGSTSGMFGLTTSEVTVNRYNAGDPIKDRIEVTIHDFPMAFYSPLIKGAYTHRPFKVIRPVEALGAAN